MTAAPSNRVSSATFAVVYRLKRVRELAEQKERDRVEIDMLWMRAQLEQDQKVAAATSTASAPEPGTGPILQLAACLRSRRGQTGRQSAPDVHCAKLRTKRVTVRHTSSHFAAKAERAC